MKKYSVGINGLRGICALIIVLFHFELYYNFGSKKIFSSGYIAVEFFFILSGFLIYKGYKEKNNICISDTISKKIKKMYPAYIYALIILISVYVIKWYEINYIGWLSQEPNNLNFISEIFMVQATGVAKFNYINGPAWYISSLIINSIIVLEIIKIFKNKSKYILILISIIIYAYFFINDYSMSPNYFICGFISSALLRGLAGMSLGCVIYIITEKCYNKINKMNAKRFNILEIISFIFFICMLIIRTPNKLNFLFFIPSCSLIIFMFSRDGIIDKLLRNKMIKYIGTISFEIYIFQSPCSNVINCWFSNMRQPYVTLFYLFLNISFASLFHVLQSKIINLRRNKNEI